MPSFSAIPEQPQLKVAFVVFEGTKLLDLAGPLQVFSDARASNGHPAYDIKIVSEGGGALATDTVCDVSTTAFETCREETWDTVLVSGGSRAYDAMYSEPMGLFLKHAASTSRRLGSICLGAFILAEGGHLAGKSATTHWEGCDELQARFPDIAVKDDAIFVEDQGVWSSAGVTAGIDMALEMVSRDLGAAEALRIAKSFVLPVHRSGGQRQFSAVLATQVSSKATRFDKLIATIASELQLRHSVSDMAARVGMSERHFSREFSADFGVSPARYVEYLRVERAAALLQQSNVSLAMAQVEAGFSNAEHMRRAFQRRLKVSPSAYAQHFCGSGNAHGLVAS